MKKNIAFCAVALVSMPALSQNTFPATGTAGIGTSSPSATFNAQIHGTTDYTVAVPSQPAVYDIFGNVITPAQAGYTANFGKTSRLGFTNTTSGAAGTDGTIIRQSALDFTIENLEKKLITLQSNSAIMKFDGAYNRINVGNGTNYTTANFAAFNVSTSIDNGISIETAIPNLFGLRVKVKSDNDYAAQIFGSNSSNMTFAVSGSGKTTIYNSAVGLTNTAFSVNTGTTENFSVKGNGSTVINYNVATNSDKVFVVKNGSQTLMQVTNEGILRSRGMKVNTQTWADYVFEKDYELRSLDEVKAYINENGHLPEVPSTAEVTENGVDVAQMNEILLKKVEELTLYLLQQDAKIKDLGSSIEKLTNK